MRCLDAYITVERRSRNIGFSSLMLDCYRVLGALLSAHFIITDRSQLFGDMLPVNYNNDLLHLAHDLAVRLLPAFDKTKTGIPYPRVRCADVLQCLRFSNHSSL